MSTHSLAAAAAAILGSGAMTSAQDDTPVRIVFDSHSSRTDIVTGKALPDYTKAQRGSFQFYNGRLDKPDPFFWYYFDGRRAQNLNSLAFIRNMKTIGTWIIAPRGKDGATPSVHPNTNCEIEHHALSFIPMNPSTGRPDPQVFVLFDDIHLIQWAPYDHWTATVSQEQFDAMAGTIF